MNFTVVEWVCLNDQEFCTAQHLTDTSGLTVDELEELIDAEVIVPVDPQAPIKMFYLHHVVTARMARRLRDDFELEPHGVALALTLMRRIDALQLELSAARAKLEPLQKHHRS